MASDRDPRSHRRYKEARAAYLAAHDDGHPCCLCGLPMNLALSGMSAWGPTIEHRIPVRVLIKSARDYDELLALVCDTSMWGLAHRRCQLKQGGTVSATALNQSHRVTSRW